MKERVGFIGLGQMGLPMAENILKAGFPLSVYNRTKEKAKPLLDKGCVWAEDPSKLSCDIVVTMVANDEALKEVSESLLKAPKRPAVHLSMSTVSPNVVNELKKRHEEVGIGFVAAPVSGRPERAKEGALWIFLAGEKSIKARVTPVLDAMSTKIFDLGEKPSQALVFKLCNNFMILGMIETFSEAAVLLEKEGISTQSAAEIWGSSIFDAPVFHSYAPILSHGNFEEGGFSLNLGLKDMRLLLHCADADQVPMPFLANVYQKLLASMNLGREKWDWSGIAHLTRELAGLQAKKTSLESQN